MRVNFLICGTQKGGTSALDAYCRTNASVTMPEMKELHFFDCDSLFAKQDPDYQSYHNKFPKNISGNIYGECTPVYMYWPQAAQRILHYNPAMKIIVLLRNPIDRAYSHWQMESNRGNDLLPFDQALRQEAVRLAEGSPDHQRAYSYVDRGRYLAQLRRLWGLFGRSAILVLKSEILQKSPQSVLTTLSEFLEIEEFKTVEKQDVNVQTYEKSMSAEERQYLRDLFQDEIAGLEAALGWDLSDWA